MKLSKDDKSWAAGGIKRRDAQHTKAPNEVPKHLGKKKSTRKWCKGREGKKHDCSWVLDEKRFTRYKGLRWWYYTCKNCHKQLDWCTAHSGKSCHNKKHVHDEP